MKAACCGKLTDVRVEGVLEKLLARRTNLRSVCVVVTVATHGVHVPNVRLTVKHLVFLGMAHASQMVLVLLIYLYPVLVSFCF